jgi:hypothetical protein
VRKRTDIPRVSMKDIYRCPTIAGLAAALAAEAPPATTVEAPAEPVAPTEAPATARDFDFVLCGALQLASGFAYLYAVVLAFTQGYHFVAEASGFFDAYARSLVFTTVAFACFCILPVLAKWVLVGRWKRRQFRIWSLEYLRFWIVKSLIRSSPLVLFSGTPVYALYLRALGARSGAMRSSSRATCRFAPTCWRSATMRSSARIRISTAIAPAPG